MIQPSKRLANVSTYYFARKLKEIAAMNAAGKQVINLGIGSPDLDPPKAVTKALVQSLNSLKANQYQSYFGLPVLRTAFAQFYKRKYNVELDANKEVLPLLGSKEGIMHIAMTYLEPGNQVLVPDPGYPAYRMTTLLAGAEPITYNLTESTNWFPDFNALNRMDLSKVKIMWVNYPNMPTGVNSSFELFERLIAFAKKHDILICHDNPYSFILNDIPISIFSVPDAKNYALELTSLSKSFNMAGWRVGALLGTEYHIQNVVKFKSNMDSGMFKPVQLAAVQALASTDNWFEGLNNIYMKRKKAALKIFDQLNIEYHQESCGLFVWGKVTHEDAEQLSEKLLSKANVFITPGFVFGENGRTYLRISLCSPVEVFEAALNRIKTNL